MIFLRRWKWQKTAGSMPCLYCRKSAASMAAENCTSCRKSFGSRCILRMNLGYILIWNKLLGSGGFYVHCAIFWKYWTRTFSYSLQNAALSEFEEGAPFMRTALAVHRQCIEPRLSAFSPPSRLTTTSNFQTPQTYWTLHLSLL